MTARGHHRPKRLIGGNGIFLHQSSPTPVGYSSISRRRRQQSPGQELGVVEGVALVPGHAA
jgi:hypothetical protein